MVEFELANRVVRVLLGAARPHGELHGDGALEAAVAELRARAAERGRAFRVAVQDLRASRGAQDAWAEGGTREGEMAWGAG